jgi:hypothetical protein
MADTAAWLVDRVIPEVPVRQWVLSLPHRVRLLCAYDPTVCAGVRRILVRAVSGFYEAQAWRVEHRHSRASRRAHVNGATIAGNETACDHAHDADANATSRLG